MSYFDSGVDAKSATEGVLHSDFRYGRLGDIFVVHESGENPREEGIVAVILNRTLTTEGSDNEKHAM